MNHSEVKSIFGGTSLVGIVTQEMEVDPVFKLIVGII